MFTEWEISRSNVRQEVPLPKRCKYHRNVWKCAVLSPNCCKVPRRRFFLMPYIRFLTPRRTEAKVLDSVVTTGKETHAIYCNMIWIDMGWCGVLIWGDSSFETGSPDPPRTVMRRRHIGDARFHGGNQLTLFPSTRNPYFWWEILWTHPKEAIHGSIAKSDYGSWVFLFASLVAWPLWFAMESRT